jgi:hypothetical protein
MTEDLMRIFRFGSGALIWILLSVAVTSQELSTQASQALPILQRSLGVLAGTTAIKDVTLTGTALRVAGSDDETGTAVLKALATGEGRMDFNFPSGPRSEVWKNTDNISDSQKGQWSGPDGKLHPISQDNLITDSSWFFPALTLGRWLSIPGYAISFVGQESKDGEAVQHVTVTLLATIFPADISAMLQRLSRMDIYVDSASGLPVALAFNIHPDHNNSLDIPVEIRLSDYRLVNGVQVPFHVEKYLRTGLILDLHFDSVTLNTGLSASDFQVQ